MKRLVIILLVICFFSCKKKVLINENILNKLATANYQLPSVYGQEKLFILTDAGKIIITNADDLNFLYERQPKKEFKNFKDFLKKTLNQNDPVNEEYFKGVRYEIFVLNEDITNQYERGFELFFSKYTEKLNASSERIILKNNKLNRDQFLTIQYYFYLNGYQIHEDDYSGFYYLIERNDIFGCISD